MFEEVYFPVADDIGIPFSPTSLEITRIVDQFENKETEDVVDFLCLNDLDEDNKSYKERKPKEKKHRQQNQPYYRQANQREARKERIKRRDSDKLNQDTPKGDQDTPKGHQDTPKVEPTVLLKIEDFDENKQQISDVCDGRDYQRDIPTDYLVTDLATDFSARSSTDSSTDSTANTLLSREDVKKSVLSAIAILNEHLVPDYRSMTLGKIIDEAFFRPHAIIVCGFQGEEPPSSL